MGVFLSKIAKMRRKAASSHPISVLIATPTKTGYLWAQTADSVRKLQKACDQKAIIVSWMQIYNDPYVGEARNMAASTFLDITNCSHLLFLDDDVTFDPEDFFELLAADKGVVAGLYPQKKLDFDLIRENSARYSGNMLDHISCPSMLFLGEGEHKLTYGQVAGAMEVQVAATGFMLIQRRALVAFAEKHPDRYVNSRYPRPLLRFFELRHIPNFVGEDASFCLRMAELGEKIYAMPKVSLGHVGPHVHHGCAICATGQPLHGTKERPDELRSEARPAQR